MGLFSKKDEIPYKIKLVERIQYVGGSEEAQQQLQQLEAHKQQLMDEAKQQLVEQSRTTLKILQSSMLDKLLTAQEKQNITEMIKHDPYIDLDKLAVPYYNIRKAIRRAHAS